ncbi:MAG: DUF4345 domain-containing protein [Hellea sp.]|nr:DUF4345 domain-containing protein [Hellea sp.]
MKRGLQIILLILSLIPLYFAVTGVTGGAAGMNGGDAVSNELDNQFRYLSAFYLVLTFLIWFIVRDIENYTGIFRIIVFAIFLGGLTRLYCYLHVGIPPQTMVGGMFLELGAPILAFWQHKVAHSAPR